MNIAPLSTLSRFMRSALSACSREILPWNSVIFENGMMPCIGTQRSPLGPRMGYRGMNGMARITVGMVLAVSSPWPLMAARSTESLPLISPWLTPSTV